MKFPYEDLYYLKARGPDDRRPAESWGGYGQDFEAADSVYTHEDVEMFPSGDWLVNALKTNEKMDRHLLVFDLDVYKAPDDFDPDRVTISADTPVVKSQSGGLHVYFAISQSSRAQESDFKVADELPFDIDIRGEFVKHHVVAPGEIPGVDSSYELVDDTTIKHYFDADEAAQQIKLDGEPALRFDPNGRSRGGGYNRESVDPPEGMPKCYGAGLELRKKAPEDDDLNTHKVNVLTALSGLAAGYDVETVADHFVDEYYPGDPSNADRDRTEYQVQHIARKLDNGSYDPPAVTTLQEYNILPLGEWCTCGLPGHDEEGENKSAYFGLELDSVAEMAGVDQNPYEDRRALLQTCLHARDEHDYLEGEKPPYAALVAVGEHIGLTFEEPEDNILGESNYNVAKRIYADLEPDDI